MLSLQTPCGSASEACKAFGIPCRRIHRSRSQRRHHLVCSFLHVDRLIRVDASPCDLAVVVVAVDGVEAEAAVEVDSIRIFR